MAASIDINKSGSLAKITVTGEPGNNGIHYPSIANFREGLKYDTDNDTVSVNLSGNVFFNDLPLENVTIAGEEVSDGEDFDTKLAAVFPDAGGSAEPTQEDFYTPTITPLDGSRFVSVAPAADFIFMRTGNFASVTGLIDVEVANIEGAALEGILLVISLPFTVWYENRKRASGTTSKPNTWVEGGTGENHDSAVVVTNLAWVNGTTFRMGVSFQFHIYED